MIPRTIRAFQTNHSQRAMPVRQRSQVQEVLPLLPNLGLAPWECEEVCALVLATAAHHAREVQVPCF